jgi:hypothetical protein
MENNRNNSLLKSFIEYQDTVDKKEDIDIVTLSERFKSAIR